MNNIDDKADIYFYDSFFKLINIKKLIDNGAYLCFNIDFFEKLNKIMYIRPVCINANVYMDYISNNITTTYKEVFIDNSIEDDYIKVFLGKDYPYNIHEDWSPSAPIGKIENLLKLKAFI
tara:strand:- start:7384 stop:7743 length:360 start_codon:yes stop_codon:yes gene_type:complete